MFEVCQEVLSSGFEGNVTKLIEACPIISSVAGGVVLGTLIALGIMIGFLVLIGLYVYSSLALYTIAKKLKYRNAWIAWIPVARIAMILSLGGFHWAWIFLLLVPILGWVALFIIGIISLWRVFEKTKNPGWFSLSLIVPEIGGVLYLIAIGIAAWSGKKKRK